MKGKKEINLTPAYFALLQLVGRVLESPGYLKSIAHLLKRESSPQNPRFISIEELRERQFRLDSREYGRITQEGLLHNGVSGLESRTRAYY